MAHALQYDGRATFALSVIGWLMCGRCSTERVKARSIYAFEKNRKTTRSCLEVSARVQHTNCRHILRLMNHRGPEQSECPALQSALSMDHHKLVRKETLRPPLAPPLDCDGPGMVPAQLAAVLHTSLQRRKTSGPSCCIAAPSTKCEGSGSTTRWPSSKDRCSRLLFSGSTPITLVCGMICLTEAAMPAMSDEPP
eukprot:2559814-Pleurochrysis_carterae.AAC.2